MATNFSLCVTQIANLTAISSNTLVNGDTNFGPIFPAAIDYAEQRLYRELDLLATRVGDSGAASSGVGAFTLPTNSGTFLVVETLNVITPAGLGPGSPGSTFNPVVAVSREYIEAVYPSFATTGVPAFFAMRDASTVLLGPAPDAAYTINVRGTQRPTPLSATNSSTILTQMLPDLFNAGLMVFMAGQMRDFGAASDNPQLAVSWEQTYKTLFQSANVEELRKRYMGPAWQSYTPSPIATPARV